MFKYLIRKYNGQIYYPIFTTTYIKIWILCACILLNNDFLFSNTHLKFPEHPFHTKFNTPIQLL